MKKTISICLFLLISVINFPALGEDTQGQDAQTLLQNAQKLIAEEKYKEAINQFETILKQFPDTPQIKDAILLLADSYIKLAQPEKAEEIYLKTMEQYKDDTSYLIRIHNALAELYISTQQLQKAIKSYHAILETEPDYTTSLQVFEKIEKLHIAQEDYAEAAEIRKKLLDIYPKLLEKHITDPSIKAFWRARAQIDRSNFTAENYSLIARLQEQADKKQDAFSTHRFLTTSFSQSPFAIKSFYSMAEHLSAQGDYNGAVVFYLNSIIRSTTPLLSFRAIGIENREFITTHNRERLTTAEVSETLGKIYTLLHRAAKAPRFQEITSPLLQPWEQAHKFVELNQFDEAIAIYQDISQKAHNPLSSLARYFISLCFYYQGNDQDVIAELTSLLEDKDLKEITLKNTQEQIFEKTLKDWQEYPITDKEEAINSQITLMSQIYQTEWIKGNFKLEFTRHLAGNIIKLLTGEKASYLSHKLIKTIPAGKSVAYQPWIYEFIIYEKLIESKLAGPLDMRKLGILYIDYGDPAKALPVFRQMLNATDDIRIKQDAYSRIMTVYARLSKEEEMKKTLKELQTLDPFSSTSQGGEIKLYTYLSENGKKGDAYKILKNFTSKYPYSEYLPFVKKQLQNIESE